MLQRRRGAAARQCALRGTSARGGAREPRPDGALPCGSSHVPSSFFSFFNFLNIFAKCFFKIPLSKLFFKIFVSKSFYFFLSKIFFNFFVKPFSGFFRKNLFKLFLFFSVNFLQFFVNFLFYFFEAATDQEVQFRRRRPLCTCGGGAMATVHMVGRSENRLSHWHRQVDRKFAVPKVEH